MSRNSQKNGGWAPLQPLDHPGKAHPTDDVQRQTFPPGSKRIATRRQMLWRMCRSLLAVTGSAAAWTLLRDPSGKKAIPRPDLVRLPAGGFAVADRPGTPRLVIARGKDPERMLRAALDAMGGVGRFVQPGDRVVLKPNVAFDRSPSLGATTNPLVLAAAVRLIREAGASEVRVLDNPINSPEGCFHRSGIRQAALDSGARVILPVPSEFRMLAVEGAELIARWPMFYRPFADVQRVIGIAPLKDHNLCGASMTMKNWYGLLGGRRNQFHQNIDRIIAELAMMMRPTFVVLDATRVLMRNGPTGGNLSDVKVMETLVVATDQVAADAYGYEMLLERDSSRLPYLELAEAKGAGTRTWRSIPHREVTA